MTTTWDHVLRTALINLHAFEFGYTVAFTGATLQSMIDAVDLCGGADLCAEASFVASAAPLGALLAAAVAGRLLDSYGRRTFLVAVSALWVVGYVVVACASSLLGFALGRAVAGAAMGATSVAVPVYSGVEIIRTTSRRWRHWSIAHRSTPRSSRRRSCAARWAACSTFLYLRVFWRCSRSARGARTTASGGGWL